MKNSIFTLLLIIFLGTACQPPVASSPTVTRQPSTPVRITNAVPTKTNTPVPTLTATIPPKPVEDETQKGRSAFLSWPLPASIGTDHISQYPNTAWTWNFLGLNQGYTCPPLNSSITNPDLEQYWRDTFIPYDEDKEQADPHGFGIIACYSSAEGSGKQGHAGTDISAPAGTAVFAAAEGRVGGWKVEQENSMLLLKHCVNGQWLEDGACEGGQVWYTTYLHIQPEADLLKPNRRVISGSQIGSVINQGLRSHLHFEVGVEDRSNQNFQNPWGIDDTSLGELLMGRS